jgi:uncharacterized protein
LKPRSSKNGSRGNGLKNNTHNMTDAQKSALLPITIPAVALIIAASIIGFSYATSHQDPPKWLNVTGSSEQLVDADTVKWSVSITRTVPPTNQAEAGRKLNADRDVFMGYLAAAGIDKNSVSIQPMSISEINSTVDYKTGRQGLTGYSASQTLVIESAKVPEIGDLAQNASVAMAEKDITLSTQSVEYYYSKLADLKLQLLTDATKNARRRGEAILAGGGGKLGRVTSADSGVFQVTAVNSADLSDYGAYDTTSPRKKVTAVVHASFELE